MNIRTHIAASVAALMMAFPAQAEVKIALDGPPDPTQSGPYNWAHAFAEHLNANGMEAVEYEQNSLGEEAERLDQVSTGLLEVSMSDAKAAGQLDGTIFGAMMPFFFKDGEQLDRALSEGHMLERINAGTTPHGVRVLDVLFLGQPTGIFTTKVPVRTFADFSGLRMRALDEIQIQTFETWGAKGTIVSWSEVPNALQTGVAEGYLNPPYVPLVFGHESFIKYFTDVKISPSIRVAIASEDWYQSLSDEERAVVEEGIKLGHAANRAFVKEREHIFGDLEAAGIEVIRLTDEERNKFREASQSLYEDVEMPEGALEAWKASIGE